MPKHKTATSFKPGNRASVGHGRPKLPKTARDYIRDLREAARELTPKALKKLETIIDDETAPRAAQVAAAREILDRGWGKPAQQIDANVKGTIPWVEIIVASMKPEPEVEARARILIEGYVIPDETEDDVDGLA